MKLARLRGRKVCDYLLRKGTVWKGKTMFVRWLPGAPRHPAANPSAPAVYIGTLASSKLDKSAVKRNRMRRRCREAFRMSLQQATDLPTVQLLISPRSSSLRSPFGDILNDVQTFLRLLHARRP